MALWCNHRVQEQGNFGTRKLKKKIIITPKVCWYPVPTA